MTRLAIAINLDRCVGCHTCALSCKMQNNVPEGMLWNRVLTEDCDVMDGVFVKNITFGPKGRVEIDYDKCIGCRMCMAACPYNARNFNWQTPVRVTGANYGDAEVPVRPKGVAEKCTLCKERTDRGEEPMCVVCCPSHARIFGDLDDPDSEISQTILNRKAWTLLENQGTRPSVHYFE